MRIHIQMSEAEFSALGVPDLVYIKPVKVASLQREGVTFQGEYEPETLFYAVHRANGERLAILSDLDSAFETSVAHELHPVSVH